MKKQLNIDFCLKEKRVCDNMFICMFLRIFKNAQKGRKKIKRGLETNGKEEYI